MPRKSFPLKLSKNGADISNRGVCVHGQVWVGGIPEEVATEETIKAVFAACGVVRPPRPPGQPRGDTPVLHCRWLPFLRDLHSHFAVNLSFCCRFLQNDSVALG